MVRYPILRTPYAKFVGKARVDNIAGILQNLGFTVVTLKPESHDVDVWVFKNLDENGWTGELVLVIEVTNWARKVYMDFRRLRRIINNFNAPQYNNSRKLLVFSFWQNIRNQTNFFEGLDIDLLEVGFQTQPLLFYNWFKIRGRANDKRPNNSTTREIMRRKLLAYLREKELI